MNCLIRLTPVVALATMLSACGVLEWNTESPSVGKTDTGALFTATGDAGKRTSMSGNAPAKWIEGGQIKQIFETERCNELSKGGFIWFTDSVVLGDWLSPLGPGLTNQVESQVDFSKQGALLVDYGAAASSGANVELLSDRLEKRGKEAFIKIKRNKSPKDKKRIQMVTHPCTLFVMPRGGFDTLVVESDQGDRLTSFSNRK